MDSNSGDRVTRQSVRQSRRRRRRMLTAAVAFAVFLAGAGTAIALADMHYRNKDSASVLPPPPPRLIPHQSAIPDSLQSSTGTLIGAWVKPASGFTAADQEAAITAFESMIGRKLAIASTYVNWTSPLPVALAQWDLSGGRVPMISWTGISSYDVDAGDYDLQLREDAEQLKSLKGPVLLRYMPEMNISGNASYAGSPQHFIEAWRHAYDIFQSVGATNVQWVWCPTDLGFVSGRTQSFYPGGNYVNWIGADGYNWAPERPGESWRSFGAIFLNWYRWAEQQPKPLLIGELGTDEGLTPGAKAAWFGQLGRQLQTSFSRVRAVVYFNSIHINFGLRFNWSVNSSPSALAAFRALVSSPYFSARPIT